MIKKKKTVIIKFFNIYFIISSQQIYSFQFFYYDHNYDRDSFLYKFSFIN